MANDLPEAGAQLVLEGVSEFINNMSAVTSGLAKVAQGLIALSGTSASTAGVIDNASQRIVMSNQKIGASAQVLTDQYGKAFSTIAQESNTAASAIEQSASRITQAISQASSGGGRGVTPRMGGAVDESTSVSAAAYERTKQAQQALADATVREANRRATAEEQASRRIIDALIAEANAANKAMSEEESALARITQEQNAASNARVEAMGKADSATTGGSLNFVRAITGMVAANNLLNISALNTAFNIGTMAASFDRVGKNGLLLGGAIGIALAGIASLVQAFQSIEHGAQAVIGVMVDLTSKVIDFGIKTGEAALKSAADYQKAMAFYVALTGATTDQLGLLNDKLVQVAQTTLFSMPKAAEAVNELARAGATGTQIISQGALDSVIALSTAAAGELSLADAAKTVTGTVGAFTKIMADGTPKTITYAQAVDAVTQAAQLSRLSFTEVSQAFRQAAPVANSANISITDLAATIAILGNASETGTLSGTSLKQVILDLEHPSKKAAAALNEFKINLFDADGKLRPFRDVVIDMNNAFGEQAVKTKKVTDEVRLKAEADIFGSRAALASNIISNQGVETFDRMKVAMEGVKAVDMANIMLLPLDARMQILQNSVQALSITFAGPFVSALSDAVNAGIKFIHTGLPVQAIQLAGQAIVAVATNQGVGVLREKLEELTSGNTLQFFNSLITFASRVQQAITQLIIPAIEKVISSIAGIASSNSSLDQTARVFDELGNAALFVGGIIANAITGVYDWVTAFLANKQAIQDVIYVVEGLAAVVVGSLAAAFVTAAVPIAFVISMLKAVGQAVDPVLGNFVDIATGSKEMATAVETSFSEIDNSANDVSSAIDGAATGAIGGYIAIADGAVTSADIVSQASNTEADNLISDMNDTVKGQVYGWTAINKIISDSVDFVMKVIYTLEKPFGALEAAPQGLASNWGYMLQGALDMVVTWANGVLKVLGQFLADLADNPLFKAAGLVSPIINTITTIKVMADTVNAVHKAWDGANEAVDRLGKFTIPEITRQSRESSGALRSLLDGLSALQNRTPSTLRPPGGESTTPGEYPGGGAGKGKGAGSGADKAANAYNKALDQAVEFADDLARTIANAGADAITKLEEVAKKTAEAASIATREYFEKVGKLEDDYIKGVVERGAVLQQSRQDREQKQLFDEAQKQAARRRSDDKRQRDEDLSDFREGQDNYQKHVQEILDRQFQYAQADKATKRSQERADEDTAFNRKLDDEERRIQRIEDLRNKHTPHQSAADIRKLQDEAFAGGGRTSDNGEEAYRLQTTRLARARARQDMESDRNRERAREDEIYTREEAQITENRKLGIEDQALTLRHARRDEDRQKQRTDETNDLNFSNQQAADKQANDDKLADTDLARKNRVAEQALIDARAIAGREHKERLDAITQRAIEEGNTIIAGLDKTLRGVQDKINDKVPEILKSGGAAMQPILDDLINNINNQMDTVWDAAHKARLELEIGEAGEGGSVIQSMGLATNGFITASVAFTQAMIDAAARMAAAVGGSTIPSSSGTTLPTYYNATNGGTLKNGGSGISAPNGPTPGGAGMPAKDPMPDSSPVTGASTVVAPSASAVTVNNNVSYNVDASYANNQNPASIAMDLGALSAISRR